MLVLNVRLRAENEPPARFVGDRKINAALTRAPRQQADGHGVDGNIQFRLMDRQ